MVLRLLTAVAVLVNAIVHLWLWFGGMRAVDVVGPAFLLNAVGGVAIAVALLVWRHWLPLAAAIVFSLATLGAFLVSVTVGLLGVQERLLGTPQVVSGISEVVAVVLAAWALEREYFSRRRRGRRQPARPPGRAAGAPDR